ncbi:glycosyltransferase [Candidatus Nitrotoga fabula]|uniref:Glyco_trans_2-like domain-containing protein n=1 Tax=Candidatus Nitrotoga fabula TaxID=2182327 RepID=A0A916F8S8_9PROT|nr:glycosyltransferase [Candidatus Nitrotoga fabula]CAE6688931.1 Glyco_trans_2-like domain-containing protein [Candidatus Nitrotoga fabula]
MMRVSLIVTSEPDDYHHKQRDFFSSVSAQNYPYDAFEFILVDGLHRISTAKDFADFRQHHPEISASLLSCSSPARSVQNNLGAAHASGELLIFLGDDFDPSPGLISSYVEYHTLNPDVNAVGIGPGLFPDPIREDFFCRWLEDSGQVFGLPMRRAMANWPSHFFYVGNASIRKEKFQSLGGFNENFLNDAGDDFEFGRRLVQSGGYSQFVYGAIATHRHTVSIEERCKSLEIAGKSSQLHENLYPGQEQPWHVITHRNGEPVLPYSDAVLSVPPAGSSSSTQVAFYGRRLENAFRRGYFGSGEKTD